MSSNDALKNGLLKEPYPTPEAWRAILRTFDPPAIAYKLLLAHVPYVFRDEPLKFALFRRTVAAAFEIEPTNVFIVGSAMSGRSLKGADINKLYGADSDIDVLIVSEPLFTKLVMQSLTWVANVTRGERGDDGRFAAASLNEEEVRGIGRLADHACRGIWRPDSLPEEADVRRQFFERFSKVSIDVLGLQLSEDTVSDVKGRVARSLDDAIQDLAHNLYRLKRELEELDKKTPASVPKAASVVATDRPRAGGT